MNYEWDNIVLDNFIKASDGELRFVSKDGVINEETRSSWYKIQDSYIEAMNSESIEIKKFKKISYRYLLKLREWLLNPIEGNRTQIEVNKLFIEKQKLSEKLFTNEKTDWDLLIAKASIAATFRINSKEFRAKEFFNILKAL